VGIPCGSFPFVDLYHQALEAVEAPQLPVGVHSPGYVANTDDQARNELWPYMKQIRDRIGAERGWGPTQREQFDHDAGRDGSLYVGSPETVARKIAATAEALDLNRFELKYSAGRPPHANLMRSIELYAKRVIPLVRDMLS